MMPSMGRTTWHEAYTISQKNRKRGEEIVGWMKNVGWIHKAKCKSEENIPDRDVRDEG